MTTGRLDLVPLRPADATEMVGILADPALYTITGGEPPTLEELRERYERQAIGRSPDGLETWLNWIARRRLDGKAIGFVQATVRDAGRTADVAWLIGISWQRRGYAAEGAAAVVSWLAGHGVRAISASIAPGHVASERTAARAGLVATGELDVHGEQRWRLPSAG